MSLVMDIDRTIPAHVPEDLIRDWPFQFGTIYKGNPYVDLVDPLLREAPEVFYTRDAYPGGQPAWIVRRFDDLSAIYKDNVNFLNKGFAPFAMLSGGNWNLVPAELRAIAYPWFQNYPKAKFQARNERDSFLSPDGFPTKDLGYF